MPTSLTKKRRFRVALIEVRIYFFDVFIVYNFYLSLKCKLVFSLYNFCTPSLACKVPLHLYLSRRFVFMTKDRGTGSEKHSGLRSSGVLLLLRDRQVRRYCDGRRENCMKNLCRIWFFKDKNAHLVKFHDKRSPAHPTGRQPFNFPPPRRQTHLNVILFN